jgi:hypothetical protein
MNSNDSGSSITKSIKRRSFFFYLTAGAAGVYALTKMPFNIFRSKVQTAGRIKVKENPHAVKRDNNKSAQNKSTGSRG